MRRRGARPRVVGLGSAWAMGISRMPKMAAEIPELPNNLRMRLEPLGCLAIVAEEQDGVNVGSLRS